MTDGKTATEQEIVKTLEAKLQELRANYAEELGILMKEIADDTSKTQKAQDSQKIENLRKRLGI